MKIAPFPGLFFLSDPIITPRRKRSQKSIFRACESRRVAKVAKVAKVGRVGESLESRLKVESRARVGESKVD